MKKRHPVVVIGSGIGGLTSAALLAKNGIKVRIFEKESAIGGRIAPTFFKGSFVDYGPHIYSKSSVNPFDVISTLEMLGQRIPWQRLDFLIMNKHNVTAKLKAGLWRMFFQKFPERFLSPQSVVEIKKLLYELYKSKPADLDDISLKEWLEARTESREIYEFMRFLTIIPLTLDRLENVSAGEFSRSVKTFVHASEYTLYPKNGHIDIINAFLSVIKENGGELYINHSVISITTKDNRISAVLVKNNETGAVKKIFCNTVVCNFPIYDIFEILGKEYFDKEWAKKILHLKGNVTSGVSVVSGTKKPIIEHNGPMLYYNRDHIRYLLPSFTFLQKKPYFFYGFYAEPDFIQSRQKVFKASKNLIMELDQIFPSYKKNATWVATGSVKVIDSLARKPFLTGRFKPDVDSPVEGLYFCGDSIRGEGNGTACAVSSAHRAVAKILEERAI